MVSCQDLHAGTDLNPGRQVFTFRSTSGYYSYIMTAVRITSGELSKQRKGLVSLAIATTLGGPAYPLAKVGLTEP